MKDSVKVIAMSNLPVRAPFWQVAVTYLLLDRFHAPQWIWGACGVIWAIGIIGYFAMRWREISVDIFRKDEPKVCASTAYINVKKEKVE
jgi:hypothetical protein